MTIQVKDDKIYCPLKNAWHKATPEERVRQSWVCRLVDDYGYLLEQMAQEVCVTNTTKANDEARGNGAARADIVVWKSAQEKSEDKAALIVVELKAENIKIHEEDYYQGLNYAVWTHAKFFVVSNEKETKFFNVDPAYIPQKLQEVIAIPTKQEALDDEKVNALLNRTKTFSRDEFTNVLHTCHNILRNNDKLDPTGAFDEISKILFIKIRFESQNRGTKVLTRAEYEKLSYNYEKNVRPGLRSKGIDQPYMQNLFDTTKVEFKDDRLTAKENFARAVFQDIV